MSDLLEDLKKSPTPPPPPSEVFEFLQRFVFLKLFPTSLLLFTFELGLKEEGRVPKRGRTGVYKGQVPLGPSGDLGTRTEVHVE